MHALLTDLAFAARTFRKKPAFAITAIATLALGIGATAAIFSVVNAVLLRPLPYANPAGLVHVWEDLRARNVQDFPWPPADFHDLRERATSFDGIAALTTFAQAIMPEGGGADAELIRFGGATPNLFSVLGARVAHGRDFIEADGAVPSAPEPGAAAPPAPPLPSTILSHEFWQRRFGGNPAVVGTVVSIGQQRFNIVGVLQPGFELLFPPGVNVERVPDVWNAMRINYATGSRINVFLRVVGRLKPGVSLEQAQRDVDTIAADIRAHHPTSKSAGTYFRVAPMHEDLVADVRPSILALMGAVTFVLLIACANVANLLLVRASARERELAVRAALGSSRWRLVRQMLAESFVLAGAAALAGVGLAWLGVRLLLALGPEDLPRLERVAVSPMVVGFAALAGLLSAIVFGLPPAIRASRPNVMDVLRRSGRSGGLAAAGWLRNGVVIVEVALSFVLLVGSGLMIRSFAALQRANPGYDANGVFTFQTPNLGMPDPNARKAFMRDLKTRLEALPGVEHVTAASPLPLDGRASLARWGTEEALADPSRFQQATFYAVLPGYFEAMKTRLIEGRTFTEEDSRPEGRSIIIDRVLAAKAFRGRPAVGQVLLARVRTPEPERFTIIGVVDHQRHTSLAADGREAMYLPDGFMQHGVANRWAIRASAPPSALIPQIRLTVAAVNPRVGIVELQPMLAFIEAAQAQTRFALVLIGIFAGIALLLAAVGLYTVLSTVVRLRTAEIGVRMAFGAAHGRIFRMMVGQGLWLSTAGISVGLVAAWALTGVMQTMLVEVKPTDPATFAAMTLGFLVIAAIACGVPARRAARLDPLVALREE
jgi:predicted permease